MLLNHFISTPRNAHFLLLNFGYMCGLWGQEIEPGNTSHTHTQKLKYMSCDVWVVPLSSHLMQKMCWWHKSPFITWFKKNWATLVLWNQSWGSVDLLDWSNAHQKREKKKTTTPKISSQLMDLALTILYLKFSKRKLLHKILKFQSLLMGQAGPKSHSRLN